MKPAIILLLVVTLCGSVRAAEGTAAPVPATARDCYNAGTRLLAAKKYAEADKMF